MTAPGCGAVTLLEVFMEEEGLMQARYTWGAKPGTLLCEPFLAHEIYTTIVLCM